MKKYLAAVLFVLPVALFAQEAHTPLSISVRISTSTDNSYQNRFNPMASPVMSGMITRMYISAWYKGNMQKKEVKYDGIKQTTIYNSKTGTSAVLREAQGERTGYIQTEEQRISYWQMNDSLINLRQQAMMARMGFTGNDSSGQEKPVEYIVNSGAVTHIELSSKTKKVNGILCKKAIVTLSYGSGEKQKMDVWYTDAYKLPPGVTNTLGGPLGLSAIEGIPVRYRYNTRQSMNGYERMRTVQYDVRSIDTVKTIHDLVFEIPKSYTIKTWEQYLADNPALSFMFRR